MSRTQQRLTKGAYAYCSHSLLLSGDIVDVFIGRWKIKDNEDGPPTRVLQKFPPDQEVERGTLMCFLKLRRPVSLSEYRDLHHSSIRPMVQSLEEDVTMLLLPADLLCTIPDGM
jgi:hypothetical protein